MIGLRNGLALSVPSHFFNQLSHVVDEYSRKENIYGQKSDLWGSWVC